jgi:Leucine-rich repeat (LRR) protein
MKRFYYLLVLLAIWTFSQSASAQTSEADSLVLVDFYYAVDGPNWTDQGNWLTGPVNTWLGITVTDGRVTGLEITSNNMSGSIPASIGQLTELTKFRLIGDENPVKVVDINGTIPAELWNCTKITVLQLKFTNLTGDIPEGIEKMVNLSEINFQQSYLGCELPEALFNLPKLSKAYLHQSNFKGKVPASLANATKLTRLYLHGNKLEAGLPFVNIPAANKAKIELTGNYFTFADIKPYYEAKANYAGFICDYQYTREAADVDVEGGKTYTMNGETADAEGYAWFKNAETVPVGTDATQDVVLNSIADEATYTCKAQSSLVPGCDLRSIYNLKYTESPLKADSLVLVEFYNSVGGPNWTNQGNWLTGPVSTWTGVTVTDGRVTGLEIVSNNMSGTIPASIGQLTELTKLRLIGDENPVKVVDIHGSIPAELWNCTKISVLQLKFTNLTGDIPEGIEKMVNLSEINFQQSYLGCELPEALFNLPKLSKAYLHQSNFKGKVPASLANATKLTRLYLHGNKLEAGLPFVNIPAANKAKIELSGNYFTFADIKPYYEAKANYAGFICDYQYARETADVKVEAGTTYTMNGETADGEGYAWFKNTETVPVGTDATQDVVLNSMADEATYTCKAQSSLVPGCDLRSIYNLKVLASPFKSDSLALVDFYHSAGGPNWTNQGNWLTGPVNTWVGVTVTDGRVTGLEITSNNMSGTIPASIGQLTELTRLRLLGDENPVKVVDIKGTIPAELWDCTKIKVLQLKFTNLTGGIPAGIEKMVNLEEINFQQSYLGGALPEELFNLPKLTKAYLHQSNFEGQVPASLANATKLTRLYLHGNKLEAGLPFVEIPAANKAKIELTGNYFTFADILPYYEAKANYAGFICDYQYARETTDVLMDLGGTNTLDGEVADAEGYAWFKNDETVPVGTDATLDITLNSFADEAKYTCKAQSTLVPGCDLRSIYNLKLNMTQLDADSLVLEDFYYSMNGPEWTDQGNWLTGPVSTWLGVTVTNGRVTGLEITSNNMSGEIPASIGQLTELTRLRLIGDENPVKVVDIYGSIPAELWNCTKLQVLQLKYTNLTGDIPAGIEKMVNLSEINLQQSYLGCELPEALFNLPSLTKAYLHQSNFTGKVPASLVNATKLTRLYLHGNKLEAGLPFVNLPAANKAKIELTGNYFTFADVKPYHDAKANLAGLIDDYQYAQDTKEVTAAVGSNANLSLDVADAEMYFWFKNNETAPVSSEATLAFNPVTKADNATYTCKVQSSAVPNFDIRATFVFNGGIAYPEAVSATTSTDGKTVSVTFDMEIDATSIDATNFAVTVNGTKQTASSAKIDAADTKTIVLTIGTAIPNKAAKVTVTYAPGALMGVSGGAVAAFGPESVTNNVTTGITNYGISVKTYPNPVSDILKIQSSAKINSVVLSDLSGRKVKEVTNISGSSLAVSVSDLHKGVYILSVKTTDGVSTQRISIE